MSDTEEDLANQKEESQEKKLRGSKVSDSGDCLWQGRGQGKWDSEGQQYRRAEGRPAPSPRRQLLRTLLLTRAHGIIAGVGDRTWCPLGTAVTARLASKDC